MEVIAWTTHRPHIQHKRSLIIYAMPSKELDEYQYVNLFSTKTKKKKDKMNYVKVLLIDRLRFCGFFLKERGREDCLYDKSCDTLIVIVQVL